jgi:hypothetical protein
MPYTVIAAEYPPSDMIPEVAATETGAWSGHDALAAGLEQVFHHRYGVLDERPEHA